MKEKIKEYFSDNRRTAITILAVIAVIVLIIGLCLSWFVEQKRLATVGKIAAPAELKITGPNETSMSEIDLAYNPDEFEGKSQVTLKRPFSVVSGSGGFTLQLARTTNISDLEIKLYRAKNAGDSTPDLSGYDNTGAEYSWKIVSGNLYTCSNGKFLNPADGATTDTDGVPNLAKDLNGQIFKSGDNPQENVISLYWQSNKQDASDTESKKYTVKGSSTEKCRVTNYIIELSWTDTTKETDVLYLIARS